MVVVFAVFVPLARLKQEVSGGHLENHTRKRPYIRSRIIFLSDDNLGRPILSSLNLGREVMVRPATIPEIAYFQP